MLPAPHSHRFSLADVVPSLLGSILGETNALGLAPAAKAVVLLVDGLGASALKARSGHARTLAPMLRAGTTIGSGFPTTTAAALATLTTGVAPGEHGLVGYTALDTLNDRVVNQLNGWDDRIDPNTWQRVRTQFEVASERGVPSFVVGAARYRDSGFTHAVLRGAEYRAAATMAERCAEARRILDQHESALVYLYVPELDQVAHRAGWESEDWLVKLEELDAEVAAFSSTLQRGEGMVLTADHGIIDVKSHNHVLFDQDPGLVEGIRHIAGEPRCLQLHFEPDASPALRETVLNRWRESEQDRAWVTTRAEAIDTGWFGERVAPEVVPRIGDLLIAARKSIAYYDSSPESQRARGMVGQHGSITREETAVPCLRFGAFA